MRFTRYLARAKRWAQANCTGDKVMDTPREWLGSAVPIRDSYDDEEYRVEVEVLEGSPPRAVLVNFVRYAVCVVVTLDGRVRYFRPTTKEQLEGEPGQGDA